jgi:hypothetical protein
MDIREAVERFETMRNDNVPLFEISRELGISLATLRRWEGDRRKRIRKMNEHIISDLPKTVYVNEISPWKDIALVLGRLSLGFVAIIVLYKAVLIVKSMIMSLIGM